MTSLVLDASVVFKLLVDEVDSDRAIGLTNRHDIVVPDFARLEVANALWFRVHGRTCDSEQAQRLLGLLDDLGFEYIPAGSLVSFALTFAAALDHPIYDCVYLALAETRNILLVAADNRFVAAARRAGLTPSQIISLSEAV